MAQNGYYSIDDCVNNAIVSLSTSESHIRGQFSAWAATWVTDTYFSRYRRLIKAVNIEIPEEGNLWVQAPTDMTDWVRLGIQFGDVIRDLDYNNKLAILAPNSKTKSRYAAYYPDITISPYVSPFWNNGIYNYSQNYGLGQGEYNGQFAYDQNLKRFIFATPWPKSEAQIYLEYQYIPEVNHDAPVITPLAQKALVSYLLSKHYLNKQNIPMYQVHDANFIKEMRRFINSENSDRAEQFIAALNGARIVGVV